MTNNKSITKTCWMNLKMNSDDVIKKQDKKQLKN